jgi:hypothetical protein
VDVGVGVARAREADAARVVRVVSFMVEVEAMRNLQRSWRGRLDGDMVGLSTQFELGVDVAS